MWGWHDDPGGWGWFWMFLMMAIFWVPVLLLLLWAARGLGIGPNADGFRGPADDLDAREVARRSYARGEIDRERFMQIMADLDESERPRTG